MKKTVLFTSLGKTADILIKMSDFIAFQEMQVFTSNPDDDVVLKVVKAYDKLGKIIQFHKVDPFDIEDNLFKIIGIYNDVMRDSSYQLEIIFNMTGGTTMMTSAILLASYMCGSKVFYIRKERDNKGDLGQLINVPTPKINPSDLQDNEIQIIDYLSMSNDISQKGLSEALGYKSPQAIQKITNRLYNKKLIMKESDGKKIKINLSSEGRLLALLLK